MFYKNKNPIYLIFIFKINIQSIYNLYLLNRDTNIIANLKMKEACVQANIYKKDDYQLKTCTTCECIRKLAKKYSIMNITLL